MSRTDALVESHQSRQDAQHQAGIDAADARADALEDYIDQAIASLLDSGEHCDLDAPLFDGGPAPLTPMHKLLAQRDAAQWADWFRLLMRAPVADSAEVLLNFRHWADQTITASPYMKATIEREAERLMALDDADAADRVAEWVRL